MTLALIGLAALGAVVGVTVLMTWLALRAAERARGFSRLL